jgi:hypothetical protein
MTGNRWKGRKSREIGANRDHDVDVRNFSGKTKDEIGPLRTIVSGGIAGTTLWTLIFPADVIKSRQQVETGATEAPRGKL